MSFFLRQGLHSAPLNVLLVSNTIPLYLSINSNSTWRGKKKKSVSKQGKSGTIVHRKCRARTVTQKKNTQGHYRWVTLYPNTFKSKLEFTQNRSQSLQCSCAHLCQFEIQLFFFGNWTLLDVFSKPKLIRGAVLHAQFEIQFIQTFFYLFG